MKPNSIPVAEQPVVPVGEFLYEAQLRHTRVTEYGFSMQNLMSGQVALPPEGASFDIAFEGTIQGPRLNGTITGVDFSQVRADGRFQLHLHAEITTDDGEKIAFFADGIFVVDGGDVRENVQLTTSSPQYTWVNQLQIWARGHADLVKREVCLKAYAA